MDGVITGSKVGITIAVMLAALMALVDISIINVALSDIRASFGTPLDQIAWVSTGYMMANVVVIPMTGWLQRRFGFRKYFAISILIFTAASALCGLAWNLPSLVAFRMLQGVGGGAIIPTAQSILFARYPPKEHGMAGALFGLGAVTGPLLGPTIGGHLIDVASWHWIFYVNVPIGILAAFLAWNYIREPNFKPITFPIDRWGVALLALGMASLQYVLEEGNREGWTESRTIVILAPIAVISLVTFIVHELEHPHPVVDLRVFKNRSYSAATGINFLVGTAVFSGSYLFSLYCGAVMHYAALNIGNIFLVAGCVQILLMPFIGRFSGSMDGRYLVAFGILATCTSLWMHSHLTAASGFWVLTRPRMVMSVGLACIFVPLSVVALSDMPGAQRGNATGLFNLTRELGGSIGTAWMGITLDNRSRLYASRFGEHVNMYDLGTQQQIAALRASVGTRVASPYDSANAIMAFRIQTQALIRSFDDAFVLVALAFALSIGLVFLLRRPNPGGSAAGAH